MFCPECGQANADAARFCTACGRSLTSVQSTPPVGQEAISITPSHTTTQPSMFPPGAPDMASASPLSTGNPAQADSPSSPPTVFQASALPIMPQAAPVTPSTPCRVCGVTLYSYRSVCPRCGTPIGMIVNAGDPTANSYVPVGSPVMFLPSGQQTTTPNNSGQRGPVPAELQSGWNWGAAFVTYLWAIAHRIWWYVALQTILSVGLIVILVSTNSNDQTMNIVSGLYTILYFMICAIYRIYFGVRGNRLAWRNRRFDSPNRFIDVQEAWKPAGIVGCLIALLVGSVVVVLFVIGRIMTSMVKY